MSDNTQVNMCIFDAPDELWSDINECVAKVVLTGKGASFLPPDVFKKALSDNGIIEHNDVDSIRVNIPFSKRKRVVYGNLKFKHK